MGKIQVTYRIMPEDTKTSVGKLKKRIDSYEEVKRVDEDPIGFGLVALKVIAFVEDKEGAPDAMENKLKSTEGVGEVQVTDLMKI